MPGHAPHRFSLIVVLVLVVAGTHGCSTFSLNSDTPPKPALANSDGGSPESVLEELSRQNSPAQQARADNAAGSGSSSRDVWPSESNQPAAGRSDDEYFQDLPPDCLEIVDGHMASGNYSMPGSGEDTDDEDIPNVFLAADENMPIREAFQRLPRAFRSQVKVYGGVNLRLSGEILYYRLKDLMPTLEDQYDLLIVEEGNFFKIYCEDADDRSLSYVYRCRNTRAADLIYLLQFGTPLGLPRANQLVGDGRGNFAPHVINELPENSLTGWLGLPPPAGPAEPPTPEYAAAATAPPATPVSLGLTLGNGIMVSGELPDVQEAVRKLKQLDRETEVVLIEVLIVQYFHDDQFTWRYDLTDGAVLKADPPTFSEGFTQPATTGNERTFGPAPWGLDFQNVAFNPVTGGTSLAYSGIGTLTSQFKQNLTFLVSENMARVVTNPHIAVINGQTGQILLNEKFNFQNTVETLSGAVTQVADSLDSLTSVNVTPTIMGPDRVHIAVNTSLATFDNVAGADSPLPGQRINELGTSVILTDKKSLILGGLVKEENGQTRSKIPYLARIPILGHLFRARAENRRFSETVVYVIPHIAVPEGFEDDYRNRVFEYSDDLQCLGEEIRERNRWDQNESWRLYKEKELWDHAAHYDTHKDIKRTRKQFHQMRHHQHCRIHQGDDCNCVPATAADDQPLPPPADAGNESFDANGQ